MFLTTVINVLLGAIAYGVGHMNQAGNLSAWRWLFILEGVPCLVLAVGILFLLPKYPETAKWLTEEEKSILQASFGANVSRGYSVLLNYIQISEADSVQR
jgi:MFS family permease